MKQKVTLKDIALRAGTSVNSVSKAMRNHPKISEKKRREILKLSEEMGYIPNYTAKYLRKRKTNLIGLIVGDNTNPYFATTIKVVQTRLKEYGYYTLTFNNYENIEDELGIITELCGLNVAGVLLTPAKSNQESAAMLRRYHIPYVLMHRFYDSKTDNYVIADDELAGFLATSHLLERKPANILLINSIWDLTTAQFRKSGYKRALDSHDIHPNPEWIIDECVDRDHCYTIMRDFLKTHSPPFSVLCYSDYFATGALHAIIENKLRIPEDIAIIGIDDTDVMLNHSYGLTSISVPVCDIAVQSVDLLIKIIINQETGNILPDQHIVLKPSLVTRNST